MKIDLTEEQLDLVKSILIKRLPEDTLVWVFGSRAKGNARKFSDLDLAIDFKGEELPSSVMAQLDFDFEDSHLPFKVDLVDMNTISASFKNNIKETLLRLL